MLGKIRIPKPLSPNPVDGRWEMVGGSWGRPKPESRVAKPGKKRLDKLRRVCYACSLDMDAPSAFGRGPGEGQRDRPMAYGNTARNARKQLETNAFVPFQGRKKGGQGQKERGLKDCFLTPLSWYVTDKKSPSSLGVVQKWG